MLETERLTLRPWHDDDLPGALEMGSDPDIVQTLGRAMNVEEAMGLIKRQKAHQYEHGFSFWAVDLKPHGQLVGMIGLQHVRFAVPFVPAIEIGWRIVPERRSQGLATEGARAALDFGFSRLRLHEIVAMTTPDNHASRAVMQRLGMQRDLAGDFDHPLFAPGHPLRPHVLYRLRAPHS
jgi:RimJ/RimL family protein N-acetyltransferase